MDFRDYGWDLPRRTGFCRHWRQPVWVGSHVVTCSTLPVGKELKPPVPDFGIYLSKSWQEKLSPVWTNGSYIKRVTQVRAYPALVLDWPDMNGLPIGEMDNLVEICLSKMRRHLTIDIGCTQGHGRTGTLLACLIARLERATAAEAIEYTRERYCRNAVETDAQKRSVADYIAYLKARRGREEWLKGAY